jgi:hypothetical protein
MDIRNIGTAFPCGFSGRVALPLDEVVRLAIGHNERLGEDLLEEEDVLTQLL